MNDDIDKATKALLAMNAPPKSPRPTKPSKANAKRKFRLSLRRGKPHMEELPE